MTLTFEALIYGTRCRGILQFFLHTHAFIHVYLPFAFPLEAGSYLPTLEEWKAELAYIGTTAVSKQSAQDMTNITAGTQ